MKKSIEKVLYSKYITEWIGNLTSLRIKLHSSKRELQLKSKKIQEFQKRNLIKKSKKSKIWVKDKAVNSQLDQAKTQKKSKKWVLI